MKRFACNAGLVLLIVTLLSGSVFAAKKLPKKSTTTTHHETLGTEQLKGEYGLIGHTYTLGKSNPWNMKLESAEYTLDTIRSGDNIIFPNRDEKLLVLHFTLHNPQKGLALLRFDSFHVTAVDADSKNWDDCQNLNVEDTKVACGERLKPAQKISVYKVLKVPAAGELPKLIVTGSDNLVIRYDLRGKVKPLAEPFADPNDKTGATALAKVQAKLGVAYPMGMYSLSVDGISYADGPINNDKAPKGGRFMIVSMTARNTNTFGLPFRYDTFRFQALDIDSSELKWKRNVLRMSSDKPVDQHPEPGDEVKFRTYFEVDKDVTPAKLTISCGNNPRVFEFPVE